MLLHDFEEITSFPLDWERFENKTILITGANGFLPAYIVETVLRLNDGLLLQRPCKVIALVRNEEHTNFRFSQYIGRDNFKILVQDVSDEIKIDKKIDFIIHAASPASPKYYLQSPIDVICPNIFGTKNTLDLAVKNNIEGYLYFSSSEVYGEFSDDTLITESQFGYLDPTNIRSCYAESKRMGENLCVSYGSEYNLPIRIVRPFHTYGPGMKLDDGRVFADFVKNIIASENIELKSDGSAVRSFCYLEDATIAFFTVLLKGENNQAYNVANPNQSITIKGLADRLISLFPEKELKVLFSSPRKSYAQSIIKSQIPDISKIKSLGWSPKTTIEDGFKKTIESYSI